MSKYNRKKENPATVVETDEFIGFWQKAFEKVRPFASAIGWGIIGFFVVVGAVASYNAFSERRSESSTEAFTRVVKMYAADLTGDEAKTDPDEKPDTSVPHFKTAKERAEATLAEIDKLSGDAAQKARLLRAGVLYDLERWDESRAAYDVASQGAPPEIAALAREGVALCFEQLNKVDDAIVAYEKVAPKDDKATEFYRDRALMGLGRLYEKKGDKKAAIASYKEITVQHPTSPLRDDAQNRLTALEAA